MDDEGSGSFCGSFVAIRLETRLDSASARSYSVDSTTRLGRGLITASASRSGDERHLELRAKVIPITDFPCNSAAEATSRAKHFRTLRA